MDTCTAVQPGASSVRPAEKKWMLWKIALVGGVYCCMGFTRYLNGVRHVHCAYNGVSKAVEMVLLLGMVSSDDLDMLFIEERRKKKKQSGGDVFV